MIGLAEFKRLAFESSGDAGRNCLQLPGGSVGIVDTWLDNPNAVSLRVRHIDVTLRPRSSGPQWCTRTTRFIEPVAVEFVEERGTDDVYRIITKAEMDAAMTTTPTGKKFWMVYAPDGGAPTREHDHSDLAETEAQRLARAHPGRTFVVLEATKAFRKTDVEEIPLSEEIPF